MPYSYRLSTLEPPLYVLFFLNFDGDLLKPKVLAMKLSRLLRITAICVFMSVTLWSRVAGQSELTAQGQTGIIFGYNYAEGVQGASFGVSMESIFDFSLAIAKTRRQTAVGGNMGLTIFRDKPVNLKFDLGRAVSVSDRSDVIFNYGARLVTMMGQGITPFAGVRRFAGDDGWYPELGLYAYHTGKLGFAFGFFATKTNRDFAFSLFAGLRFSE